MQVFYRSNAVLFAIPLSASVLGEAASVKASIIVAFLVPLYNVSAVFLLEYFRGGSVSFKHLMINVLKTPLIVGAIAGVVFNMLPITMPQCLASPIAQLSNLATPMALFVLGGTLHFSDVRKNAIPLLVGTIGKLIVLPAVMITLMVMMKYEPAMKLQKHALAAGFVRI